MTKKKDYKKTSLLVKVPWFLLAHPPQIRNSRVNIIIRMLRMAALVVLRVLIIVLGIIFIRVRLDIIAGAMVTFMIVQ
jgi:hypothetical protein